MRISDAQREAWLIGLMDGYADALTGFCAGILGDHALAQDAVQETFLKAWRHARDFRGEQPGSEKAWLYRIALNQCRSMSRAVWFRQRRRQAALSTADQLTARAQPEEIGLYRAVRRLPAKSREAILLHYYEEMPVAQMAEALHITASSVYRRLETARRELKEELKKEGLEDA